MKKSALLLLLFLAPFAMKAQLAFGVIGEAGYTSCSFHSAEMPIFFEAYNTYQQSNATGLTQPFKMKFGISNGSFFNLGGYIGDEHVKAVVTMGNFISKTGHNEARYDAGDGRDMWARFEQFNSEVGVRFGDKFFIQPQFDIIIQTVRIYSAYVFPDQSQSFGWDHTLNGIYRDFRLTVATGGTVGLKLVDHINLIAKADYIFNLNDKHPEYHQYEDLSLIKSDMGNMNYQQDFLPRDMNEYYNAPYNATENSISNDYHGLRLALGLQFYFGQTE